MVKLYIKQVPVTLWYMHETANFKKKIRTSPIDVRDDHAIDILKAYPNSVSRKPFRVAKDDEENIANG